MSIILLWTDFIGILKYGCVCLQCGHWTDRNFHRHRHPHATSSGRGQGRCLPVRQPAPITEDGHGPDAGEMTSYTYVFHCSSVVAQRIEHRTLSREIPGSNPWAAGPILRLVHLLYVAPVHSLVSMSLRELIAAWLNISNQSRDILLNIVWSICYHVYLSVLFYCCYNNTMVRSISLRKNLIDLFRTFLCRTSTSTCSRLWWTRAKTPSYRAPSWSRRSMNCVKATNSTHSWK